MLPIVGKHFAAETFPQEFAPELADLGLFGMQIKGYGCVGRSAVCCGLACQELGAGDSGLRTFVSVQGPLTMFAIARLGTEEQKLRWLPRMARGEVVGCFALSEPKDSTRGTRSSWGKWHHVKTLGQRPKCSSMQARKSSLNRK